jgi:hypothetical protein
MSILRLFRRHRSRSDVVVVPLSWIAAASLAQAAESDTRRSLPDKCR